MRYAHEELVKQKSEYKNRIQDREAEIERLRNQVGKPKYNTRSKMQYRGFANVFQALVLWTSWGLKTTRPHLKSLVSPLHYSEFNFLPSIWNSKADFDPEKSSLLG